jgi:hypothetical protein
MAKLDKQSTKAPPGLVKHDDHSIGTLDVSSYDTHGDADPSNDEMFFGDGNLPTNYNITIDDKADVELGLKIHYRTGDDITPISVEADGTAHYEVPAGTQVADPAHNVSSDAPNRAAWNFDFSVNTGIDGSTNTLDDFDFRIILSDDDGNVQKFDLQHVASGNTPWVNDTTGAGATLGGFDDEDGSNPQLSQNSVNLGFGFLQAAFGDDALAAGEHYALTLQAFDDHGKIVGQVQDDILLV